MKARAQQSILVVEDERIVATDIQQMLRELGYDAFAIAASAEEALARASERCPDLVLMDIRIKGTRDGITTAELLKAQFGVSVVYLTAHADDGTLDRAKRTEPHAYLLRPVRSAELRIAVEVSIYKHEAEKQLRKRERWFSTTLRSIADAVIAVDVTGKVTFMNATAELLTGAEAGASSGKSVGEVLRLVDHEASGQETPVLEALRLGRSIELREGNLMNVASGALRLINDSAAPVIDHDETLGAVMVFRDVTEQKQLQAQLESAQRLASLGTMAAGLAHEVNNPLAVVSANTEFLLDELHELQPQLQATFAQFPAIEERLEGLGHALSDVQSAASRIARIIADVRAFSGPASHAGGSIHITRCVEWAVRSTAHELRHRAALVTELGEVPLVEGDEARMGQVLINLIVNAAHAIAPGNADANRVTIRTHVSAIGEVVLEVADTGQGISSATLVSVFEPFFTTKAQGVGTGLGLWICRGIVTSMNGTIAVESTVGRGTLVRITLPAAPADQLSVAAPATVPEVARLRGRVLIVDDEAMMLRAMKRVLAMHELTCVSAAQEALELIARGDDFDVILCDLTMPVMTGPEFYAELQRHHPRLAARVVFLTGGAISQRFEDFLRATPNEHLQKPFRAQVLQDVVQGRLASPDR